MPDLKSPLPHLRLIFSSLALALLRLRVYQKPGKAVGRCKHQIHRAQKFWSYTPPQASISTPGKISTSHQAVERSQRYVRMQSKGSLLSLYGRASLYRASSPERRFKIRSRASKIQLTQPRAVMCKWIVQVSERLPSLLEWTMILTCMLFSEYSRLISRSEAISFRLSQFVPTNHQSARFPMNDDRMTRQDLKASNTFIQYVQVWMLFHTTSAPLKIQAKIWPVIIWGAFKTAAATLLTASIFSYITLTLSHPGVLPGYLHWTYRETHLNFNWMLARLFLDLWRPRRLLLSKDNLMLPSQQLCSRQEQDVWFACIGGLYFLWCLFTGLVRSASHFVRPGLLFGIDLFMNVFFWMTLYRYTRWRGAPGSTLGYDYVPQRLYSK